MNVGAMLVLDSQNEKIGRAAATYASVESTCPPCPLKGNGCYAQHSRVAFTNARLNVGRTAIQAARDEAKAIDSAKHPEGRPLRLHVSGDCRTDATARIVSAAARRWTTRGGGPAWVYTHAWRTVARESWGFVSTLASVERTAEGVAALARGYAPAAVVASHPTDGRGYAKDGVTWIPCPAQTRDDVTCSRCRLCFDASRLVREKKGIAFSAHGQSFKRVLKVIS